MQHFSESELIAKSKKMVVIEEHHEENL